MWNLIQYFLLAFLLFFVIGAVIGYEETKEISEADAVFETALNNTDLVFTKARSLGSYELQYSCEGKVLYRFDFAINQPLPETSEVAHLHLSPQHRFADKFKIATGIISSSIGLDIGKINLAGLLSRRVTASAAVEEVEAAAKTGLTLRQKISILAGGASGYLVGYALFIKDIPSCHSDA